MVSAKILKETAEFAKKVEQLYQTLQDMKILVEAHHDMGLKFTNMETNESYLLVDIDLRTDFAFPTGMVYKLKLIE